MKEDKMDDDEIIQFLKEQLGKPKKVEDLAKKMQISKYEVLGYIQKLKDMDVLVDVYEQDGTLYVLKNYHPDLTKENVYYIKENLNSKTKFAVISDLRFGSRYEQVSILHDMYQKFAKENVKYVIVAGNLIEGTYKGKDASIFGKSLITNDPIMQAKHVIDYFPKVNGIETLFITGKNEHDCAKVFNAGNYIGASRDDMKYLGPKSCTLYFNNVKFRVEQLKNGDAYTVSYPLQKYSRSMSSYEDYDAVFLSGGRNFQHFPKIRNTQMFSVPSAVDRTPKMVSNNQSNTIGAYLFELEYTNNGKMRRLIPTLMPYYKPSQKTYLNIPKLVSDGRAVDNNNNEFFDSLIRLYDSMHKEEEIDSLCRRISLNRNELMGVITYLQTIGYPIETIKVGNQIIIRKRISKSHREELKPCREELHKKELLIVSDTHYGSIWCQPSMVNTAVYEAYNRGITDIIHVGDITDGDYARIRPNHVNEVFLFGATGQFDYVVNHLPKYKGMKWHMITGSHDQTHLFNYGFDIGKKLEMKRDDIEYLGQDRAIFYVDNCAIEVFHPGGGSSRIVSTKPQNGIDQMPSLFKPNLSLRGHYHKYYGMLYRNIHTLLCPCNVDQSSFMMKNELPNIMGDYFLTIYYDDDGNIEYLTTEPMIFSNKDVRVNDWENPKRNLKSKILTLKNN